MQAISPAFIWRRLAMLLFFASGALTACGQVTFSFVYADSGTGFNDATLGATRRAALESAAATLAGYLTGYTQTVTMTVSSFSANNGTLASAGSPISAVNGFQRTFVQRQIQDGGLSGSLGTVNWNFFYAWDYDNSVAAGTFDFRSVAMHELMHALGFLSFINAAGQGGFQNTSGSADAWFYYDQFLTTANGTRLVNSSAQFNTSLTTLSDGASSDVYFNGPNAMAANGGQLVPIYSPVTFQSGSSLSHLDTDVYGTNNYIMTHAVTTGPSVRTLSDIELGILADLGYSVTAIPEPALGAGVAGMVMFGVTLRRRRTIASRACATGRAGLGG